MTEQKTKEVFECLMKDKTQEEININQFKFMFMNHSDMEEKTVEEIVKEIEDYELNYSLVGMTVIENCRKNSFMPLLLLGVLGGGLPSNNKPLEFENNTETPQEI